VKAEWRWRSCLLRDKETIWEQVEEGFVIVASNFEELASTSETDNPFDFSVKLGNSILINV